MTTKPRPGPERERLNILIGRWNTEGKIKASASGPAAELKATDSYEWLPGGFFVLHRVDARMGEDELKSIEVIGYDAANRKYFCHSFDDQGNAVTYQANLEGRAWTIVGESERFDGEFSKDGNALTGAWERRSDGSNWQPWIVDVRLTRIG